MPSSEPLIRCAALVRRFGERPALAGLDLEVARGETVIVTGPNGSQTLQDGPSLGQIEQAIQAVQ